MGNSLSVYEIKWKLSYRLKKPNAPSLEVFMTAQLSGALYKKRSTEMQETSDIQAYDAAKSRNEEIFPAELGVKLSEAARAGKSLVPVWREYREMTQTALAEASGVNRVYLSEIESGKKPGSVEALKRIAEALRIGLDDLV